MKMRWCKLGWGALAVCLVFVGILWIIDGRDRCPIRYENYDQIKNGMTHAEVEALLGCPPGDHCTGPMEWHMVCSGIRTANTEIWRGDHGEITIAYDGNGAVSYMGLYPGERSTLWNRIREKIRERIWPDGSSTFTTIGEPIGPSVK